MYDSAPNRFSQPLPLSLTVTSVFSLNGISGGDVLGGRGGSCLGRCINTDLPQLKQ